MLKEPLTFDLDHDSLLGSRTLEFREICGISNKLMELLLKICSLRSWKQEAENAHCLSIIELANRGSAIYEELSSIVHEQSVVRNEGNEHGRLLTLCYAQAAIVYVHVLLSGPNLQLREIRDTMRSLIASLTSLGKRFSLHHGSWPVFIAACFGLAGETTLLRSIVQVEQAYHNHSFDTCGGALRLAEEYIRP